MNYDDIPTISLMGALDDYLDEGKPRNEILDEMHTHSGSPRAQNYGKKVSGTDLPYSQYYDRIDSGWSPEDARGSRPKLFWDQIGEAIGGFLETKNPVEMSTMAPVIGDFTGPAYDAYVLKTQPEQRTPLNYALAGVGALPLVPSVLGTASRSANEGIQQGKYTSEAEALRMGHHDPQSFSTLNQPTPMLMREPPEGYPSARLESRNPESGSGLYSRMGRAMNEISAKPGQAETTTLTDYYKKLRGHGVTDQEIAESGFNFNDYLNEKGNINVLDAAMGFNDPENVGALNDLKVAMLTDAPKVSRAANAAGEANIQESAGLYEDIQDAMDGFDAANGNGEIPLVHNGVNYRLVPQQDGSMSLYRGDGSTGALIANADGTNELAIRAAEHIALRDEVSDAITTSLEGIEFEDLLEGEIAYFDHGGHSYQITGGVNVNGDNRYELHHALADGDPDPLAQGTTLEEFIGRAAHASRRFNENVGPIQEGHGSSGQQRYPIYSSHVSDPRGVIKGKTEERILTLNGVNDNTQHHFNGAFDGGYIAHARTSGRNTYVGGKKYKVRHIDEIQSDVHQKGQNTGYRLSLSEDERRAVDARHRASRDDLYESSQSYLIWTKRLEEHNRRTELLEADKQFQIDIPKLKDLFISSHESWRGLSGDGLSYLPNSGDKDVLRANARRAHQLAQSVLDIPHNTFTGFSDQGVFQRLTDSMKALNEVKFVNPDLEKGRKAKIEWIDTTIKSYLSQKGPTKMPMSGDTWIKSMINDSIQRAAVHGEDWVSMTTSDLQVGIWSERFRKAYENTYDKKGVAQMKKIARELGAEFKYIPMQSGKPDVGKVKVPAIRLTPEIREKLLKQGLPLYGSSNNDKGVLGYV